MPALPSVVHLTLTSPSCGYTSSANGLFQNRYYEQKENDAGDFVVMTAIELRLSSPLSFDTCLYKFDFANLERLSIIRQIIMYGTG